MMGLGRERRLNCRLYVDRQADATVIEKLDRLLVEKHFQNQTELIKHGIELVYQEVYERENVGSQADISGVDLQKLAEAIADELKPELRQLLENCEERILKEVAAMKLGSGVAVAEISDVPEKKGLSGQAIGFLKSLNND